MYGSTSCKFGWAHAALRWLGSQKDKPRNGQNLLHNISKPRAHVIDIVR